ncbi:MAG: PilZ domain-containing protein [Myxococcales bacterium]|jgi:uncharacterized protein (TIGR02266 family)
MAFKIVPAPGTPAAELLQLSEVEAALSREEVALLEKGAEIEAFARDVQVRLDEARAALQRLASSPVHSSAEAAFMRSLGLVVPPHVASAETAAALEARRQALAARERAAAAERAAVEARAAQLAEIDRQVAEIKQLAGQLASQAEQALARARAEAQRQAAAQIIDLTRPKARPASAPIPAPAQQAAPASAPQQPAAPVAAARPAAAPQASPPAAGQVAAAGADRRQSPRHRLQVEVSLSSESNFFTGFSGDISETGIFVATYETLLPPGTPVDLSLKLPARPALSLSGVVRWVRDSTDRTPGVFPGMGIEFRQLSSQDAVAVQAFLQKREPMFWAE